MNPVDWPEACTPSLLRIAVARQTLRSEPNNGPTRRRYGGVANATEGRPEKYSLTKWYV